MAVYWIKSGSQKVGERIREVQEVVGYISDRGLLSSTSRGQGCILSAHLVEQLEWKQGRGCKVLMEEKQGNFIMLREWRQTPRSRELGRQKRELRDEMSRPTVDQDVNIAREKPDK